MKHTVFIFLTVLLALGAAAQTKVLTKDLAAPTAKIDSPADGFKAAEGTKITFSGSAADLADGTITDENLFWEADLKDRLGTGAKIEVTLPPGSHIVTLKAHNKKGKIGIDSVLVNVIPKEQPANATTAASADSANKPPEKPEAAAPPKSVPPAKQETAGQPPSATATEAAPGPASGQSQLNADALRKKISGSRILGVCLAIFHRNENPDMGVYPTLNELKQDLNFADKVCKNVRSYGAAGILEKIPVICEGLELNCLVGAWISRYPAENKKELAALQRIADKKYDCLIGLVIGNEVLLRQDQTVDELIAMIRDFKAKTKLPVSTAETWSNWLNHPELAKEVDFILVHIHPYWDGVPIEQAADYVVAKAQELQKKFPGKKVVIGETGWPAGGEKKGQAVPSPENQARFIDSFTNTATRQGIGYFYFDLFDESWKEKNEGPAGATWGLFNEDGSPKEANVPFVGTRAAEGISRPPRQIEQQTIKPPIIIYDEDGNDRQAYKPSGWMGDGEDEQRRYLSLDPAWTDNPHSGKTCTKISYQPGGFTWAGIFWQYPLNNWGQYPGYKVVNASRLTFWARGEKGGERVIFKIGGIENYQFKYQDSLKLELPVKLTKDWQQFIINLQGQDTGNLMGGFCWVASGAVTIYLDDIVIE